MLSTQPLIYLKFIIWEEQKFVELRDKILAAYTYTEH